MLRERRARDRCNRDVRRFRKNPAGVDCGYREGYGRYGGRADGQTAARCVKTSMFVPDVACWDS